MDVRRREEARPKNRLSDPPNVDDLVYPKLHCEQSPITISGTKQ